MEKYKIEIKRSAEKEIEALPKAAVGVVMRKIHALAHDPRPIDSKKLTGSDLYRLRAGVYRIVYEVEDTVLMILVVKVAHRKDVYR